MPIPHDFDRMLEMLLRTHGDKGATMDDVLATHEQQLRNFFGTSCTRSSLVNRIGRTFRQVAALDHHKGISVRVKRGPVNDRSKRYFFFAGPSHDLFRFDGRCWNCAFRATNYISGAVECHRISPDHDGYPIVAGQGAPLGSPEFCSKFKEGVGVRFSRDDIEEAKRFSREEVLITNIVNESSSDNEEQERILQLCKDKEMESKP